MATRKTPLGILREITPRGLFPLAPSADDAEADTLWQLSAGNYSSYHAYRDSADEILRKELDAGRLEWAPTVRELETRHGPIKRSKIGVVAQQKQGKLKLRLIHDLKRSGVYAQVKPMSVWCYPATRT